MAQDRLEDEACRRGLKVPGLKCPSKKSPEKEEEAEPSEAKVVGERPEEVTDDENSDPAEASGIVFSFPDHKADGIHRVKLDCDGHDIVDGRWWARVEAEDCAKCKVIILPSRQRVTFENLEAGHYVCSGGSNPSCERSQ